MGPDAATGVKVKDLLPAGLIYVSDDSGGVYDSASGIWMVGAVAKDATATIRITAKAVGLSPQTNAAEVQSSDLADPDSTPDNASSTEDDDASVTINPVQRTADLYTTIDDSRTVYIAGSAITYQVVVGNAGPDDAMGIGVTDIFPANLKNVTWECTSSTVGAVCPVSGPQSGNLNTLVDLPQNSTLTFTVSASAISAPSGDLVDTVTLSVPAEVNDTNSGNNADTDTDLLAEIALTKTASPSDSIDLGGVITYTFVLQNTGNVPLDSIAVSDPLISATSFVCGTTTLLAGEQTTCTQSYTVTVNDARYSSSIDNTASATANTPDIDVVATASDTISVWINLPQPPQAVDDQATTKKNTPVTLKDIAANDNVFGVGNALDRDGIWLYPDIEGGSNPYIDSYGNRWELVCTTNPDDSITCNGDVLFTPAPDFIGTATVPYRIWDLLGQVVENDGTLTVTVTDPIPPTVVDDQTSTPFNTPVTLLDITSNDTAIGVGNSINKNTVDLNPAADGLQTTYQDARGEWVVDVSTGDVTFTPVENFFGTASIPYTVQDQQGLSGQAQLIVDVAKPISPTAQDDSTSTVLNIPVTLTDITANDVANGVGNSMVRATIDLDPTTLAKDLTFTDTDGNLWTVDLITGDVTFTPADNFTGIASILYSAADELNQTITAALKVTVSLPLPPTADDESAYTLFNTPVSIGDITIGDAANGQDNTIVKATIDLDQTVAGQQTSYLDPAGNTWTVDTSSGEVMFTPGVNYTGTDTIQYQVADELGQTVKANLTVTVEKPLPPSAKDDSATTSLNTPVDLNDISVNDTAYGIGNSIVRATLDLDPSTPEQETTFEDSEREYLDCQHHHRRGDLYAWDELLWYGGHSLHG